MREAHRTVQHRTLLRPWSGLLSWGPRGARRGESDQQVQRLANQHDKQ